MAPNQVKSTTHWFLSCLGIPLREKKSTFKKKKGSNNKKSLDNNNDNDYGSRRRLFKLCMPKIRVIIIRKKKVISFDSQACANKTNNKLILDDDDDDATHDKHILLMHHKHASITNQLNVAPKGSNDTQSHPSPKGKPSTILCSEEGRTPRDKQKGMMNSKAGKDSLKGVLIMVIMLIIMSIWGRLCAILCMSAWLYCVPLLRTYRDTTTTDVVGNMKIDMATKLFRKKVTLEGLLQTDT